MPGYDPVPSTEWPCGADSESVSHHKKSDDELEREMMSLNENSVNKDLFTEFFVTCHRNLANRRMGQNFAFKPISCGRVV